MLPVFLIIILLVLTEENSATATKGTGFCLLRETIKNCQPKCNGDFECADTMKCCVNTCGSKSCSHVSPVAGGENVTEQGLKCGNRRCRPNQKCIPAFKSSMKRPFCK